MQSFYNWFNEHGIIAPIKESKADWELRCYLNIGHLGKGRIMTIKCVGDSVVFEDINMAMNNRADSAFKKSSFISINNSSTSILYATKEYLHLKESTDSILNNLVKERLFTIGLADTAAFIQEREQYYKEEIRTGRLKDRCQGEKFCTGFIKEGPYDFFEIKIQNHFREFGVYKMIYYNVSAPFSDETYLGMKISHVFGSAFNNSYR